MQTAELARELRRRQIDLCGKSVGTMEEYDDDALLAVYTNIFHADEGAVAFLIDKVSSADEFMDLVDDAIWTRMAEASRNCELVIATDRGIFEAPMLNMFPVDADKPEGEFLILFRPVGGHVESCHLRLPVPGRTPVEVNVSFEEIDRNHFCPTIRQKVWAVPMKLIVLRALVIGAYTLADA